MQLPVYRRREAQLIDVNMKNAFKLLSNNQQQNKECQYIFSKIPHAVFNSILETNATVDNIESLVEQVSSHYASKAMQHCWWISERTEPRILPRFLLDKGYTKGPSFCGLHAKIDDISFNRTINRVIDPKITVRKILTRKDLEEWVKPIQVSFDFSNDVTLEFLNCYIGLINDPCLVHFFAFYADELAGSSTIFFDNDSAGLYNGGVFPKFRRLGIITHLAERMIEEISNRGCKDLVVQASDITQHLARKIGFKEYINYTAYFSN